MKIYYKNTIKNLFSVFMFSCSILCAIILMTQILKMVYLIERGVSIYDFLFLAVLRIPSLLTVVIPLGAFCSLLYVFLKMKQEKEILVYQNAGISHKKIAFPAIVFSFILTSLLYFTNIYLSPVANKTFRIKLENFKENYAMLLIEDKIFARVNESVTLYVESQSKDKTLNNLIIIESYDNQKHPNIMFAKFGKLNITNNKILLELTDGHHNSVNSFNMTENLRFDNFKLELFNKKKESVKKDPYFHELSLIDLIFPSNQLSLAKLRKSLAFGHQKIVWPLVILVICYIITSIIIPCEHNRQGFLVPSIIIISILSFVISMNFIISSFSVKNYYLNMLAYMNFLFPLIISYVKLSR